MNVGSRLAWRNLWRHSRRTWLTVGAMIFCNVLLVFMISLQLGSYGMMIDNSLGPFTGHAQIQHKDYLDDGKMRQSVPAAAALAQQVRGDIGLESVSARAVGFALASSEERSFGVQISGVQAAYEPLVSTLPGLVVQGRYLSESDNDAIVIGRVLATNLRATLGDEITFLGSGRDGSFAAGVATVVGIVDSGIDDLDRAMAHVPLGWFQEVFAMGDHGHQIVIRFADIDAVTPGLAALAPQLDLGDELVLLDWDALLPGLRQAITSDMASAWMMYGVLVLLVAFSVLNTQLMSVLERTREFGVMLALGMKPSRIACLVGMETLMMAALGLSVGVLGGAAVVAYLSVAGFHFPGMEEMASQFNLPDRIYPEVSALGLLWGPLTVFVMSVFAALYPALRIFRLRPVPAMRAV